MATPSHYRETQLWLANALEGTAAWRMSKAREYTNDQRNGRSGNALVLAAHYVRGTTTSPGVQRIAELVHDCAASDIDLVGAQYEHGFPGAESSRAAGRYFFDHFGDPANGETHEELLDDIYHATLRDLADLPHAPGSPLGRRIRSDEPAPTDPLATAIGELRELLRDAWSQRRATQLVELSRLLGELSDAARAEAAPDGRLPALTQPTRVPMLRRQLSVALKAYYAVGGSPPITAAQRLIDEPQDYMQPIVSGVIGALDEIAFAMEQQEVVRSDVR